MAHSGIQRYVKKIMDVLHQTTVEPVLLFNFLALPFFHVSQQSILYSTICLQDYATEDDPNVCDRLQHEPDLEDQVQKDASTWNMYMSLSYLLPAILSDMFLGAWSDRNGRKVSILVGFTGLISASLAFTTLAVFPHMHLYIIILANVVAGMTGYIAIIMISCMAYLSDTVTDKASLSFRMTILLIAKWVADVIGSFTTGIVLRKFTPAIAMVFAQAFFAMGFFYALIRLHQLPPEQLRANTALKKAKRSIVPMKVSVQYTGKKVPVQYTGDKAANLNGEKEMVKSNLDNKVTKLNGEDKETKLNEENKEAKLNQKSAGCCKEFSHTCITVGRLYEEVWQTLGKPRKRHRRLHIFICTMVFFCLILSEVGLQSGPLMSLYVFRRPFDWSPSDLGTYRGVQSVCNLIGSIIGALLTKYLKLAETTMMLLSITSGMIHLALVGLSQWSWMLYLGCATGSFNSLLFPSVKAFLVGLVEPNEVGKAFAAMGIAADLAFVFSTIVFTNIYSATVELYAGTVFLFAAAILAGCLGAVLWMRIDYNRKMNVQQRGQSVEQPPFMARPNILPSTILSVNTSKVKQSQNGSIDMTTGNGGNEEAGRNGIMDWTVADHEKTRL